MAAAERPRIPGPIDAPGAIITKLSDMALVDQFGKVIPPLNDPAWQRPSDPLKRGDPRASAMVINREIPNLNIGTSWGVDDVRRALVDLPIGMFDLPSQLWDAVRGEARMQATIGSRTGGLFGRPVRHTSASLPSVKGSRAAKECRDAWVQAWPTMMPEPVLSEIQEWGVGLGFAPAQLLWDTSNPVWIPHVRPWATRYTYYHWTLRCYVALTMDGSVPITAGDGHWLNHAPHGEYRGWMHGAVRAIAQPWLISSYAYRDWARYSERHGMPIIKAMTPAAGDKDEIAQYRNSLATLGQESVIALPQGVEKQFGYDLDLLEATDQAWQGFAQLIDRCEMSIVLALLHQNLTTEVKEGSYAAARIHGDVRQSALEADGRALSQTIYRDIARPFAALNFGDPDLAPKTSWKITPYEDSATAAKTFVDFATAIATMRKSGYKPKGPDNLRRLASTFGLRLTSADFVEEEPILPGGTPPTPGEQPEKV